jgi:acetyltransferase-like isoleucine patch superfamily enzyme
MAMKAVLRALFQVPAFLLATWYRLKRSILGEDRAFLALSERLAGFKGYLGIYLRAATYRLVLERSSAEVQIGYGSVLSRTGAVLEEHVYVGRYCSLGWVHVERDVMLADFVAVPSGAHAHALSVSTPPRMVENRFERVRIGRGTWVGTHAVILADVGRHCIIGAGAVVTKPIPDHSIAVGVPARVVRAVEEAPDPLTVPVSSQGSGTAGQAGAT